MKKARFTEERALIDQCRAELERVRIDVNHADHNLTLGLYLTAVADLAKAARRVDRIATRINSNIEART